MTAEEAIQRQILDMLAMCFPHVVAHHSPNAIAIGGKAGLIKAARNKANGTRAGYPDLTLMWAGGNVAFLEVKVPGLKPTPKQVAFHDLLKTLHFRVATVTDADGAYDVVKGWGAPRQSSWGAA